ncbi:MAG: hypothetical protein ACRD2E_08935, partial [Terriglobales bacterium]
MRKRLAFLLVLAACAAAAQSVSFQITATTTSNVTGQGQVVVPIPGAQILVCSGVYTGTACTLGAAITVYQDSGLSTPWGNPFSTDQQGNVLFWTGSGGNFFYTVSGAPGLPATYQLTLPSSGLTGDNIHFNQSLSGGTDNTFFANPFYALVQQAKTPTTPTTVVTGSTGHTWGYEVVELVGPQATTAASGEAFASAAATLNASNYVTITAACESNNDYIQFYRVLSGGTPSSTGAIGAVACATNSTASLNDTGLNGNGSATPTVNTSGDVAAQVFYVAGTPFTSGGVTTFNSGGMIQFPAASSKNSIFSNAPGVTSLSRLGMNFAGNVLTFADMNLDGSIGVNSTSMSISSDAGPVMEIGLGLGGTSASSASSVWPEPYTQTNGANVASALFSTIPIGGSSPGSFPGPIQTAFVAPKFSAIVAPAIGVSNVTFLTCNTNSGNCNTAGLYQVNLYVSDNATCVTPGPAEIGFTANYTDTGGARSVPVPMSFSNLGPIARNMPLGTGTNSATATMNLWSTGAATITVTYTTVACTTG